MNNTLPDRLREIASEAKMYTAPWPVVCAIGSGICASPCDKYPEEPCAPFCAADALNELADEIERDYVRIPEFRYEEGRDAFTRHMKFICEENIVTCVSESVDYDSFVGALVTQPSERIFSLTCVEKPQHDTLEEIDKDSKLSVDEYCRKHKHVSSSQISVTCDLLRRQRKVLESDGE